MEEQSFDTFTTQNQFQYSAVEMDELGATEYTLVNILVDETPSITAFRADMEKCIQSVIESCQKHPKSENLLVRVAKFNSHDGIKEIHGFSPLSTRSDKYKLIPNGMTNLYDAAYDSIDTVKDYAERLIQSGNIDRLNTVFFVITDGEENDSSKVSSSTEIGKLMNDIRQSKNLESTTSILIGVNDSQCQSYLDEFHKQASFTHYKPMGEATPDVLSELAGFIYDLVSSTSMVLGSGKAPDLNV